jgi:hypothetical protein
MSRWLSAVLAPACAVLAACASMSPKEAPVPRATDFSPEVAVVYAASGGTSRTDASLFVDEAGGERMFLGSTMSLPPTGDLDRVGAFEGTMPARLRKRLAAAVAALPTEIPDGGPAAPGSVVRFLTVTVDGRSRDFTIPGVAPAPLDAVEKVLQEAMVELVSSPAETVSAAVDTSDAAGLTAVLTSSGTRAVTVRLATENGQAVLRGSVLLLSKSGESYGAAAVPPDTATSLVSSGAVSKGAASLAPGASLRIPIPTPATDDVPANVLVLATLEFEVEHDGRIRPVSVQAPPMALAR